MQRAILKPLMQSSESREFIYFANHGGPSPTPIPDGSLYNSEDSIRVTLPKLRTILDLLIKEGKLRDCEELQHFIKPWELAVRKLQVVDNRLEMYLGDNHETTYMKALLPSWLLTLSRSLIEYLMEGDFRTLRKCQWHKCKEKYFIASRNDTRIKYCPNCSRLSKIGKVRQKEAQKKSREKKQKKRQEEKARIREIAISNYMSVLKIPRRKAEALWRRENT